MKTKVNEMTAYICTFVSLSCRIIALLRSNRWKVTELNQTKTFSVARYANKREHTVTLIVVPPFIVEVNTVLISHVVWLLGFPKDEIHWRPIRPNPVAFFMDVTESNPSKSHSRVKVPDQACDEVLFLLTVDRHQVCSL